MTGRQKWPPLGSLIEESEASNIIRIIEACQANLQLEELRVDLFNYWPLLVFEIVSQCTHGRRRRADQYKSTAKSLIQFFHGSLPLAAKRRPKDVDLDECDALFFSRPVQFTEYGSGIVSHPSCDGIDLALGSTARTTHVVFGELKAWRDRTYFPYTLIPKPLLDQSISLVWPRSILERKLKRSVLDAVETVNRMTKTQALGVQVDGATLLNMIENIHSKALYFIDLFQRRRPKIIFLSSFTGSLYVCVAANALGIPVVDIQHGGFSEHHFLACDWRLPNGAHHELMPNVFWCWDHRSQSVLTKSIDAPFQTVVGGNPKSFFEMEMFGHREASNVQRSAKPNIFVALSYGKEQLLPNWLRRIYKETEDIWNWEFRLHPRGLDRLAEAADLTGQSKQTLYSVAQEPISLVWSRVDILVTGASSLIYDAIEKTIPVAVWSEYGAGHFKTLVDTHQLTAAFDYQNMLEFLKKNTIESRSRADEVQQDKGTSLLAEQIRSTFCNLIAETSK